MTILLENEREVGKTHIAVSEWRGSEDKASHRERQGCIEKNEPFFPFAKYPFHVIVKGGR